MTRIRTLLIAVSLLIGTAFHASAQVGEARNTLTVGINGGVNLTSVSFSPSVKQNKVFGFTGGVTARYTSEIYFSMICGAQIEINFSQKGWDQLFETTDSNGETVKDPTRSYTRKMSYVDIPFLAHLAFGNENGLQFFLNLGPQISLLMSESETMDGIDMKSLNSTQQALYGTKAQNKFDYGITGGGGVEFNTKKAGRFFVEGRYYFALSDFYKTSKKDYFDRAAHGTITIKAGYLFDLKK